MIDALERMVASFILVFMLSVTMLLCVCLTEKCNEMLELLKECERIMYTSAMENSEGVGYTTNDEEMWNQISQSEGQQ